MINHEAIRMKNRSCTSHKAGQGRSVTLATSVGISASREHSRGHVILPKEGGVKTAHTEALNYEVIINWPSKVFPTFYLVWTEPIKLCPEAIISSNRKGTSRAHSLTDLRNASVLCYLKCIPSFQKLRKRERGIFSRSPPLLISLTLPHLALYISQLSTVKKLFF